MFHATTTKNREEQENLVAELEGGRMGYKEETTLLVHMGETKADKQQEQQAQSEEGKLDLTYK